MKRRRRILTREEVEQHGELGTGEDMKNGTKVTLEECSQ